MALTIGARLGPYEIQSALGAGGMGEVYRARDTKLDRSVAIKILPDAFAHDPERLARFEREAKTLAALNHPNIATLYGCEEIDGRPLLIMELVEGETLADRLARGPLPLEEAVRMAIQITEALEAAHEYGIVHRDLKPANIKFSEGSVKVLDFGLAKVLERAPAASELTRSPTLSVMATQAGIILGTAAYMSPEQAKGLPADHRSDVFSFGVVLCEMLSGRRPFGGETVADVLASLLAREPDLSGLPADANPRLTDLVRRCLAKSPKQRWQAIGDLRAELETVSTAPRTVRGTDLAAPVRWWKLAAVGTIAAVISAMTTGWAVWRVRPVGVQPVARLAVRLSPEYRLTSLTRRAIALSPDGRHIAYVGERSILLRPLSQAVPAPIRGTERAPSSALTNPVFSPDGNYVAFYLDRSIKKVTVTGGTPTTLCAVQSVSGMSWDEKGILYAEGPAIKRVAADGGQPEVLVQLSRDLPLEPHILPDGRSLLFVASADPGGSRARIMIQQLPSGEPRTLIEDGRDPLYLVTGHMVFSRGGILFAGPFDLQRLAFTQEPVPIVEGVLRGGNAGLGPAQFAISRTGTLVYLPGPSSLNLMSRRLMFVDMNGARQLLAIQPAAYQSPRISPDGRFLAVDVDDRNEASVYIYSLGGAGQIRRLTVTGHNRFPRWAPDSQRVTFQSDIEGDAGIFWQRADGASPAERLTKAEPGTSHMPEAWSPDGKTLLYAVVRDGSFVLHAYSTVDKRTTQLPVRSMYPPSAAFAPDGQWIAYYERAPGAQAGSLFVRPFPTGERREVVRGGGIHPVWLTSQGRTQLLYRLPTGLYTVDVTTQPTFELGRPIELPVGTIRNPGPAFPRSLDLLPGIERLVTITTDEPANETDTDGQTIQVVLNWLEELKQRVATR